MPVTLFVLSAVLPGRLSVASPLAPNGETARRMSAGHTRSTPNEPLQGGLNPSRDEAVAESDRLAQLRLLPPESLSIDEMLWVYSADVKAGAEYLKLPVEQVAAGLRMQEPAGRLWQLAHSLTPDFGGAWIDWYAPRGPAVALGVTREKQDAAGREALAHFVAVSGLPVSEVDVTFSYEALLAAAHAVQADLERRFARDEFTVMVSEQRNAIEVSGIDPGYPSMASDTGVPADDGVPIILTAQGSRVGDTNSLGGGWRNGVCTMGFAVIDPTSQGAITTAGHGGPNCEPPTHPNGNVVLGSAIEDYDQVGPDIDRQLHVIPSPHTPTQVLWAPGVSISRGLPTRLLAGSLLSYHGGRGAAAPPGGCGRLASQPITLQGFSADEGQFLVRSTTAMAGGGDTWLGGDSGGPVWTLNTAVAMITAGPLDATCATSGAAFGFAVGMDRQLTDVPGSETMDFMLQESAGNGLGFAAMGTWHAIPNIRLVDTRVTGGAIPGNGTRDITIPSPPADLGGVTATITTIPVSGSGHVTMYPVTSGMGSTFATPTNAALVAYGSGVTGTSGTFRIVNSNTLRIHALGSGSVHVIVDYTGSYSRVTGNVSLGNGAVYQTASNPIRVYDSRDTNNPLGENVARAVQVTGIAGIPANALGVAVNVVGILPTQPTYLTVYSNGDPLPATSNLNLSPGQVIARLAQTAVSSNHVNVFNRFGSVHFIVDVVGWYVTPNSGLNNGRVQLSGQTSPTSFSLAAGESREVDSTIASVPNGPKWGTRAALINIRASNATANGFLVVHELSSVPAGVSTVNYHAGISVSNGSIATTEDDGTFWITNSTGGSVTVKIDITGWYLD